MRAYRDSVDIVAAILKAAETGASLTSIMLYANLNYLLVKKYLKIAADGGLLKYNGQCYEITQKGESYLKTHNDIQTINAQIQESMKTTAALKITLKQLLSGKEPLIKQEVQSQNEKPILSEVSPDFKRIDYDQFFQELLTLGFKPQNAAEITSWINIVKETKFSALLGKKPAVIKACLAYIGGKTLDGREIFAQRKIAVFYGLYPATVHKFFKRYLMILKRAKPDIFGLQEDFRLKQ